MDTLIKCYTQQINLQEKLAGRSRSHSAVMPPLHLISPFLHPTGCTQHEYHIHQTSTNHWSSKGVIRKALSRYSRHVVTFLLHLCLAALVAVHHQQVHLVLTHDVV